MTTCVRIVVAIVVAAGTAAAAPIEKIEVRGTKRIEPETIRVQLGSKVGHELVATQLRADLHSLWRLGVFSDLAVTTEPTPAGGVAVVFEVTERAAIRKVLVAGNDDVKLDKINDVLDLERERVADMAAIRRNRDKIVELYNQQGFLFADVDYELVPAGTGQVDVKYTVVEHSKVRVQDVELVGNKEISDGELRKVLVTKPPGALSFLNGSGTFRTDALERDLAMLTAYYIDHGYATAKIGSPALRISRDRKSMHVTIPIDEGPKFSFGALEIKGDLLESPADHLQRIGARSGAVFSRSQVEKDVKTLQTYYQDRGFAMVSVVPRMRLDQTSREVVIGFEIVRGKRVYIERIHIRGNAKTSEKVIRRELKIAEGELYNGSRIDASKRHIMVLGYFDNVAVSTARGSSEEFVDVNIEVHERPTGQLQFGLGFSSVESIIGQAQVAQENFLGRGWSLGFQAMLSRYRRIFSFRFVEPRLGDSEWSAGIELYNTSRGFGTYSRNATGAALTLGHPLGDHARASLTYRIEDVSLSGGSGGFANFGARTVDLPTIDTGNLLRGGMTSSLRGALTWDTRNNRLLPTGGSYAQAFVEYAGAITGSDNQFVRYGGFARRYQHLGGPFTLRLNGEVGVTTSLDGKGVPLTERYLLGGIYDIRGYLPRSIGPQLYVPGLGDPGGELRPLPLGGNLQVIGNAEIEFPLVKRMGISGVAFFDIGNAYNLESRFCGAATAVDACGTPTFGNLRKSVGLGIRWQSPLGPLRFEWGIPLDLKKGEKPAGLDFTIGASF